MYWIFSEACKHVKSCFVWSEFTLQSWYRCLRLKWHNFMNYLTVLERLSGNQKLFRWLRSKWLRNCDWKMESSKAYLLEELKRVFWVHASIKHFLIEFVIEYEGKRWKVFMTFCNNVKYACLRCEMKYSYSCVWITFFNCSVTRTLLAARFFSRYKLFCYPTFSQQKLINFTSLRRGR